MTEPPPETSLPDPPADAIDAALVAKALWFLDVPAVARVTGRVQPAGEHTDDDDAPEDPPSSLPAGPVDEVGDGTADPDPPLAPPPVVAVPRGTPVVPAGRRQARRVADTAAEPTWARHNWVPTGPRNVGGRVRALVGHPTEAATLYAGAAAGGVYRTRDAGETWEPLWHDQRVLGVSALATGRSGADVMVYAATGEPSNEEVFYEGDGVHVSRDGGDTWDAAGPPTAPGTDPDIGRRLEAVAVHPVDGEVCWAVGDAGVFRTVNGGGAWTQHLRGRRFTDVAYSPATGAAGQHLLYLVPVEAQARGAISVIRIELAPQAPTADVDTALAAAAHRMQVVPPEAADVDVRFRAGRAKLAICTGHPEVAYLRVSSADGEHHLGLFRTQVANGPLPEPAGTRWDVVADHPHWGVAGQASYDLCVAVHPREPGTVVTGQTEMHLSDDCHLPAAGVPPTVPATFVRILAWDLNQQDRAHHADQHAALFRDDPADPRGALWVANDGGVSRSLDWHPVLPQTLVDKEWTPEAQLLDVVPGSTQIAVTDLGAVAATAAVWRKRGHGIDATMMYSLTQHPAVPGTLAVGLQDNGCWMTTGGRTWASIGGGDGGFVTFSPDDPYDALVTSQNGVTRLAFPGVTDDVLSAQAHRFVPFSARRLTDGFLPGDPPAFVADTAHHPRDRGRAFHTRVNRLYGTDAAGEAWVPLDAGDRLEIRHTALTGTLASLEVRASPVAAALGLAPQLHTDRVAAFNPAFDRVIPPRPLARVVCGQAGPFRFADGDELRLVVDGTPRVVPIRAHPTIPDLTRTSVSQLAAYLRATQAPVLDARVRFEPAAGAVRVSTRATGAAARLTLSGDVFAVTTTGGAPRPAVGAQARTYSGEVDRPASVTLVPYGRLGTAPSPAGDRTIGVAVGAGPVVPVRLRADTCADPSEPTAGELAAALRAALDPALVAVTDVVRGRQLKLTFLVAGAGIRLAGTMLPRLQTFAGGDRRRERHLFPPDGETFDLRPPGPAALVLRIDDAAGTPIVVRVAAPADVPDLAMVTVDELRRVIDARLRARYGAGTRRVRVDPTDMLFGVPGQAVDLHAAPGDPDTLWVGSTSGAVFASRDSGATWTAPAPDQLGRLTRASRRVGAVAVHPTDSRVVYLGHRDTGARERAGGVLWRSADGGATWEQREDGLRDGAGRFVGVNGLQVDPEDPRVVYAATEAGVFRSADEGAHWVPFNEGLPNARVVDVVLDAATRTLRVGAWGRGTYARHVGGRPPHDVRLHLRAHALDLGERAAGRGPDGLAAVPSGVSLTASPDVKLASSRPAVAGPGDASIDGVEHDLDVVHEAPHPGAAGVVLVQVHNDGWAVPTGLRVVALWTEVVDGPPPVPPALWAALRGGPLAADVGPWHVLADVRPPDPAPSPHADAARPRVVTADVAWPAGLAGTRTVGVLTLVGCTEDPLAPDPEPTAPLDVLTLLQHHRRAAYRETPVRGPRTRLVLESTDGSTFDLADNGAAGADGAIARLGLSATAALTRLTVGRTVANLGPPGGPRGLAVTVRERVVDVVFEPATMPESAADMRHVSFAAALNACARALGRARVPVGMGFNTWAPAHVRTPALMCTAGTGTTVSVDAPSAAAPEVVSLNLHGGFAAVRSAPNLTVRPPYDLRPAGGVPRVLRTRVRQSAVLNLDGFPIPAAVPVDVLRTRLDAEIRRQALPLRVLLGEISLRVRRTGRQGAAAADLVTAPAAVAAGPARDRLFEVSGPRVADVPLGAGTHLYLRTSNDGDAAQVGGRHRAFALPLDAAPLAVTPIGAAVTATVPERGAVVVELPWDTSGLPAGSVVAALAVADDAAEAPVDVPASFPDLAALDAFCASRDGAGYRLLRVG